MTSLPIAFGAQIGAAAARHHLDPRLLAAVAAQETGGPGTDSGRNIVGDGGHGRGLFQIDDRWHAFARDPAALDPARNADYAAGLLQANLQRYGGDVKAALSAYNTGSPTAPGTRTDWGDGRPLAYADSVLRHYARLGGSGDGGRAAQTAFASAGSSPDASRGRHRRTDQRAPSAGRAVRLRRRVRRAAPVPAAAGSDARRPAHRRRRRSLGGGRRQRCGDDHRNRRHGGERADHLAGRAQRVNHR